MAPNPLFEALGSLAVRLLTFTAINRHHKHHHLMVNYLIHHAIAAAAQLDLLAVQQRMGTVGFNSRIE